VATGVGGVLLVLVLLLLLLLLLGSACWCALA
jgi:hypothetical protein